MADLKNGGNLVGKMKSQTMALSGTFAAGAPYPVPGATFTPTVSPDGVLSWTNDRDLDNPPPVNIKGENGEKGATPKKGVDYYTEAEQAAFTTAILEELKANIKAAKIGEVTLFASNWVGGDNLYLQKVTVEGVTENSQVDLTPDVQQLAIFYEKDITFVTENEGGVVTVYVIGQKPTNDYTIQVTITEVDV
jgi:hypothetical protein